jgi:membrane protein DedA with SNARE-associated domain
MEIQNIFNAIGIFFLFVTVGYFVGTYLENVPSQIKAVLSFILAVILFLIGDYLRRIDA